MIYSFKIGLNSQSPIHYYFVPQAIHMWHKSYLTLGFGKYLGGLCD